MNRRGFFLGASAFLVAPAIVRASSLMPVSTLPWRLPIDEAATEAAFAEGFEVAPRLTWEWEKGFRLGDRAVTDEEAFQDDAYYATRLKAYGESAYKSEFHADLRAEFHRGYTRKTSTLAAPPSWDDEAAAQAWHKAWREADDNDFASWRKFRAAKEDAGLLPDWYVREYIR